MLSFRAEVRRSRSIHSKFLRIYAFLSNTKIIIFKNIPLFTGNYIQNMQYICLRSGTYFNVSPMK